MPSETLVLTIEADVPGEVLSQIDEGSFKWSGGTEGVPMEFAATRSEEGEGFGLTEILTIVISIGGSVASDLIADGLRTGLRGVIRRVRSSDDQSDGSAEEIAKLIDRQREQPVNFNSETGEASGTVSESQEVDRDV